MEYEVNRIPFSELGVKSTDTKKDCGYCIFNHAIPNNPTRSCAVSDHPYYQCLDFEKGAFINCVFVLQHTLTREIIQPEEVTFHYRVSNTGKNTHDKLLP